MNVLKVSKKKVLAGAALIAVGTAALYRTSHSARERIDALLGAVLDRDTITVDNKEVETIEPQIVTHFSHDDEDDIDEDDKE